MTVCVIAVLLCISAALVMAGAHKLNEMADRWDRYSQWFHPPDDDDGVSLLEEDDDADGR